MESDIILHRSLGSPYAEKAILMLNYAKINWKSVIAPKGVPRPIQETLVGNYSRRIPILQIGADLYCDTDMISRKIAEMSGIKEMDRRNLGTEANLLIEFAEGPAFGYLLGALKPTDFLFGYCKNIPCKDALAFFKDRIKLKKQYPDFNPVGNLSKEELTENTVDHFQNLDSKLSSSNYLFSNNAPTQADFTVFTNVWYHYSLNRLRLAKSMPNLQDWLFRMMHLGKGQIQEIEPNESIQIAKRSSSQVQTFHQQIEMNYSFQVNDYLGEVTEPIHGQLISETEDSITLKRKLDSEHFVHIHLPKKCLGACG